jgi:phosphate transport system protein
VVTPKHILGTFDEALSDLRNDLLRMAGLTERSLHHAIDGLLQRDDGLCTKAIADDEDVDQLEKQVDKVGVEILLRYQPVASDLRQVVSGMKLSPNIERVADEATNIAERARRLNKHPPLTEVNLIVPIQAHAIAMFKDGIDAFVREDVDLARAVISRDKQLDDMNACANRQLTERMMQDRDQLRGYLNLILISRCLERVGDHATNIAEEAVYAAAAEDIRHQPSGLFLFDGH